MGKYGWKINNYMAATIVGKNTGVRDRYSYTEALLHKSLFTSFLQMNGMTTDKADESTRDIICIDFQFGLRGYDEEMAHLKNVKANAERIQDNQKRAEKLAAVESHIRFAEERKDLYRHMSKDDIRRELYVNGAPITYTYKNRKTGEIIHEETIEYKMLYRNPSKAKEGSCLFIRKELYDKARDWLTMGLADKMDPQNAKIVELSAYAPLSTSSIEGTVKILPEEILILEEQESTFRTIADIVKAKDYQVTEKVLDEDYSRETGKNRFIPVVQTKKMCVVEREETDVVNAMWDGQALIESSTLPSWCNGMGLLRNHFFKSCAFKANIQLFLQDYCRDHGLDYDTFEIEDMFGVKHLAKNIKVISTDSSCKWKKFVDLMGNTLLEAYKYWVDRLEKDGFVFGIVKTDHPSKLGSVQQMSYQMINTLPCNKEDIDSICKTSIDYVERMKENDDLFVEYLKKVANPVNHYEMLIDLYHHNPDFKYTKFWRVDKTRIIGNYINHLRKGKITVEGDNLTVCGNPYGLLLYAVGEDWRQDPTLLPEDGVIQVYTRRFEDGEYLCGIRSPQNSANNLSYYHNSLHPFMEKYFDFSNNILAVNCNQTDIQARMNGMDFDSDFNFVTNQSEIVKAAKKAYEEYPTVVNKIGESGTTYKNSFNEYAKMDSMMQHFQRDIGASSDVAQLSLSYYANELFKSDCDYNTLKIYYDNFVILAVLAQCAIDSCKKVFEINVSDEIKRIRSLDKMKREKDYPKFMKFTKSIALMKNGKPRPYGDISKEKRNLANRIDENIVCPMNWLEESLDTIKGSPRIKHVPIDDLFVWENGTANVYRMSRIKELTESYDNWVRGHVFEIENGDNDVIQELVNKEEEIITQLQKCKLNYITINHLVGAAMKADSHIRGAKTSKPIKASRKLLNLLYSSYHDEFMRCFIQKF